VNRTEFDDYLRRFNEEDPTAFDDYIASDMKMLNGALEFSGVAGMRDHYENKIWPYFTEALEISAFIGNDQNVCVKMWAKFTAKKAADTLFGEVKKGEQFDFRGLILYDLNSEGKFSSITVAYNSFTNTKVDGEVIEMGIPH
jgi:hypothetical protein